MMKIRRKHILILLLLLLPICLLGISNYFFAASSYQFTVDTITNERTGRYWEPDIDGVLYALVMCAGVIVLWIPAVYFGWLDKLTEKLSNRITNCKEYIKENKKKILLQISIIVSIALAALAVDLIYSLFSPRLLGQGVRRIIFFASVGFSLYSIIIFRSKPEKLFFSISMIIGTMYVLTHPMLFFGFDNEMHYAWAVEESYIANVSVLQSDLTLARTFQTGYFGWLPSGEDNAVVYSFQKGSDTLTWVGFTDARTLYSRIAHIYMGIVMFIGRSVALHPNIVLWMVMLSGHLLYTVVVYFAIKRLSSGKYLMAAIAMAPLTFLISTTLGNDHWMKAFILLGFAYCFYEIQNPDKKLTLKNTIIMIGAFLVGLSPKAIYFPIMIILYCIRKNKFKTEKEYRWYLLSVTGAIVFVLSTLFVPYLLTGGTGYEDSRGVGHINSPEQIMFILQNPLVYTGVLLNFMRDYLNLFYNERLVTWYISYGHTSFPNLAMLLIMFTALTDRCESDKFTSTVKQRLFMALILFSTISLFITAMYIGFTEVGSLSIEGVQKRYLIPLLFPFFYVICSFNIENRINKTTYSSLVFGISSLILLNGAWRTFIP